MKPSAITTLSGMILLISVPASSLGHLPFASETNAPSAGNQGKNDMKETHIKIKIGAKTFSATLSDNPTASAFKTLLPLTLEMSDLHGNEKFFHLPSPLPSNEANPGTIQTGDLMLWNSKSLVLFYKTFPTSYSYTKLGRIHNPEELSKAVGAENITVEFKLE